MKFPRSATLALATTLAASASAFTMTTGGRSLVTRASAFHSRAVVGLVPTSVRTSSSTGLNMFFGNLFGGGGAAEARMDYSVLDHPGPELAKAAESGRTLVHSERDPHLSVFTAACGCFWGAQLLFDRIPGVMYTAVGYTQGKEEFPTYGQVCSGATGHTEGVVVYYDPKECSYEQLLDAYFGFVDPTTVNGQGNDYGTQYRTGVYFHTPEQEEIAKARFEEEQKKYKKKIASELKPAMPFWPAEKYHQQYLEKGGRLGQPQSAEKGATDKIRCYG